MPKLDIVDARDVIAFPGKANPVFLGVKISDLTAPADDKRDAPLRYGFWAHPILISGREICIAKAAMKVRPCRSVVSDLIDHRFMFLYDKPPPH